MLVRANFCDILWPMTNGSFLSGYTAAKQIAEHGANVILACRDEQRARKATEEIKSTTGNKHVSYQLVDVSDFNSIKQFARGIKSCHILLNNAGAVIGTASSINGMESTMMTNYIGPWYLTRLLLPVLAKTSIEDNCETRIINVGSRSETGSPLGKEYEAEGQQAIDRLFDYNGYDAGKHKPMKQYAYSKLGNMMFSYELARQLKQHLNDPTTASNPLNSSFFLFDKSVAADQGIGDVSKFAGKQPRIVCNAVTPGFTNTDIFRFSPAIFRILSAPLRPLLLKSATVGGSELVYACSQGGINGTYFGEHMEVPSSETAKSEKVGGAMWKTTEALVRKFTGTSSN